MAQEGKQRSKVQPRSSSTKWKNNEVQDSKMSVTEEKDAVQHMSEHQQRQCMVLLRKLMRHKFGWVFNEPVDAEKLGLHDYHSIIKHPMDLGTVKERIMSNFYASPLDFATDVRLTFSNALLYNPKTDDVHAMALTLSTLFEDSWQELAQKFAIKGRDAAAAVMNCDKSLDHKVASNSDVAKLDVGKVATQSRPVKRLRISFGSNLQRSQQPVRELTVAEKVWLVDALENAPDDVQVDVTQIIQEHHPVVDGDEVDVRNLDKVTLWRIYKVVRDHHGVSSSTSSAQELIASDEDAASEAKLKDAAHDSPRSETHRELVEKTRNDSASVRDTGSGSSSPPSESKPRSRSSSPSDCNSSASSSEGSDSDSSSASEESSSSPEYEAEEEVE